MPAPADGFPLSTPARLQALARTGLGAVPDETFDRFAAMVRTVLGVPVVLVSLVGAEREILPGVSGLGDPWARRRETPLSHSFAQHVVTTAEPLVVTDARTDPRVRENPAIEDPGVLGYAGMPLTDAGGQVLGSLAAIDHQPRRWTETELGLLADLAAACSDSLRLRIAGHLAGRPEPPVGVRVLADRRTAAAIMQKELLTALPRHPQLTLAARHEDQVGGGDWYDAITLDAGRLALVIGDVAGHSIAAAAAMSQYRSMLRTLLVDRHEPPSALLRRLEHTSRTVAQPGLATVLVAYLDPDPAGGHTLTWANAGHPPPSLLLPDGRVELLAGRDPLLGAARRSSRRNHTRHLPPGTTLLLHTGGPVETGAAGYDDGVARLHDLLARHAGAAPEELADLVLRHAAGALLVVATPGPLRLPFTADLDGAAIRSTARRVLTGRQAPDLIDDTLVVITELVQNAVEHSGAGGDLVLTTRADGVLVEVLDGSPEQPMVLPPDPRRVGGRGLLLVAALAQDWGSRPVGAGKIVWARLPATSDLRPDSAPLRDRKDVAS